MTARLRACWGAVLFAWYRLGVSDRLMVLRFRLRQRRRFRGETRARLEALDGRIDALFRAMALANEAAGLGAPDTAYETAAAVQGRRSQIHLVRAGGGQ